MSIYQGDIIIITAMRAALADIRRNQFLIDDIMCQFIKDPLLKKAYGQTQVDRFKEFLRREINILMETKLPDTSKLPAIIIKMGPGIEDSQKQGLGDSDTFMDVSPDTLGGVFPTDVLVAGPLTPESYDPNDGELVFKNPLPDGVFEGQFVFDEVNRKSYVIQTVLSPYMLVIDTDLKANFTNMTIRPQSSMVQHNRKSIWFYETYTFMSMSTDPNELLYLWSLVMYTVGRYKKTLFEGRAFENMTISYSEIYPPNPGDTTNLLWARDVTIRGRVEHSFIESTNNLIEGISSDLLIGIDVGVNVNLAADQTSKALWDEQVSKQGWELEKDAEYHKKT